MIVRALLAVSLLALAAPARAGGCKPVHGFYTSSIRPCDAPLCTAGELIGGLQGAYAFVQTGALPASALGADPALANALFYVGTSDVALKRGDHVYAADSGVIDLASGKQSALLVVTGGTGAYAGASGFLRLRGTVRLATGEVEGDYDGELCAP